MVHNVMTMHADVLAKLIQQVRMTIITEEDVVDIILDTVREI